MKKRFAIAAIVAALVGTALHFLYELYPSPLSAILAPINESPWEHLKLLFWPTLSAAYILACKSANKYSIYSAFFLSILIMPVFLLSVYYLLVFIGADSLVADIALYYVTMLAGFYFAYRLAQHPKIERIGGFLLMLVILYGSALVLFSFAAPDLGVFRTPQIMFKLC